MSFRADVRAYRFKRKATFQQQIAPPKLRITELEQRIGVLEQQCWLAQFERFARASEKQNL